MSSIGLQFVAQFYPLLAILRLSLFILQLLMSVPLCHSSGGSLKETNEKHQFQFQINVFFPLLNSRRKKKSTSAYTDIAVIFVCLTPTDFFLKTHAAYCFSCVVCNIFPHTVSHLRQSAICRRVIIWSIATFVGHLLVTANTLQMTCPPKSLLRAVDVSLSYWTTAQSFCYVSVLCYLHRSGATLWPQGKWKTD